MGPRLGCVRLLPILEQVGCYVSYVALLTLVASPLVPAYFGRRSGRNLEAPESDRDLPPITV
jgi:hypothetical protein